MTKVDSGLSCNCSCKVYFAKKSSKFDHYRDYNEIRIDSLFGHPKAYNWVIPISPKKPKKEWREEE